MILSPEQLFLSPHTIIGREHELTTITSALDAPHYGDRILYFEGQGGIGKTRLLAEACDRGQQPEGVLVTHIIDLYLTRYHQPIMLMRAIVRNLRHSLVMKGIQAEIFTNYDKAEQQFLSNRSERTDIDQTRRNLVDQVFLQDYAQVARDYRIILLIDTFEKLHPEITEIEEFNFRQTSRLEIWLINLIAQLPNTLTMLAGRPRTKQRDLLRNILGSRVDIITVAPFTLAETEAYIQAALEHLPGDPPLSIEALHYASAGRPVVLTIALACAHMHAFDISALPAGFEEQYPGNRALLSDAFVRLIVNDLQIHRPEFADLLTKAVYLRKGLRMDLLRRIYQTLDNTVDLTDLEEQMDMFMHLPFVKTVGDEEIILHDEMYELLFGKLGEREAPMWYHEAIDSIDDELQQIAQGRYPSTSDLQAAQRMQTLQVERLFYQMSLDPRLGYQHYRQLSSSAIQARDVDFDTQLQDEIARFYDEDTAWGQFYRRQLELSGLSWESIVYDEGVRWVYRRIASNLPGTNRYSDAVTIAQKVRQRYPHVYAESTLARCDLEVAQLQAEIFIPESTPRGTVIVQNYQTIVSELEELQAQLTAATQEDPNNYADLQYAKFILANAYNYWGYYDRVHERLQSAIEKYKRAIRLFKDLGVEVDSLRATTLNNLGFALSRQGISRRGLNFLQEALRIARAQGAKYRIATTLNTMAHVRMDMSEVDAALENVAKARELFEELNSVRGRALCALAEGRVRSRVASLWQDSFKQDHEYQRAIDCNTYGMKLFDYQIEGELTRRIEARLWTSKTYRDWGQARSLRREDNSKQMRQAIDLLNQAKDLCTTDTPQMIVASILEAMAVIYVDQQRHDVAMKTLKQARALIPASYDILPNVGVINTPETQELRIYWLRLGQVELQHALCEFGQRNAREGCVRLLRAITCLLTFSPETTLIFAFREIGKRELSKIADAGKFEELRQYTLTVARDLRVPSDAIGIVESLFAEAIEDLSLI